MKKILVGFFVFFAFLTLVGTVMHFTGYTFQVVDQIYCRGYLPWNSSENQRRCQYRSGDDLEENDFIARELRYLADNSVQQTYSERLASGYPIGNSYAATNYTLLGALGRFMPPWSAANFSALILLFISFTVGFAIARTLNFSNLYSFLFGTLSITLPYVALFDAWNMALIGFGLSALGILQFYKNNRKYLFILLTAAGAFLIIASSIYQLYLYATLAILLIWLFYRNAEDKKKFVVMWVSVVFIFFSIALIMNLFLENHLEFLNTSSKVGTELPFSEILKRKTFSLDPLGWVSSEVVSAHKKVAQIFFGEDNLGTYRSVTFGPLNPGPAFLILLLVGLIRLYKQYKGYVIFILFWLFYMMGPLQLLLGFVVGEPFRSETSIRASYLFFLFGTFAVIWTIRSIAENKILISKGIKVAVNITAGYIFLISSLFIIVNIVQNQLTLEPIYALISSALFIIGFNKLTEQYRSIAVVLIFISVILPNMGRIFLYSTPAVLAVNRQELYFPDTRFENLIRENRDIAKVALVSAPGEKNMPPNGPVRLDLSSVTAYRNPPLKSFFELYNYHRFIFENGTENPTSLFNQFQKSSTFLSNTLNVLKAPQKEIVLDEKTIKYFRLNRVNAVISSENLVIGNSDWKLVGKEDGLTLWKWNINPPEYFFADQIVPIPDKNKRLDFVFSNQWNIEKQVIVEENLALKPYTGKQSAKIELIDKKDGYRLFNISTPAAGILTLPINFDRHFTALWKEKSGLTRNLDTLRTNHTFLGIIVPEGRGSLEIIYSDKPRKYNKILEATGLILLLGLIALFMTKDRRNQFRSLPR